MSRLNNPYAKALDGLILDDPVSAFFNFCRERENIRQRRELGSPPPWTNHPIFKRGRFLNVFREEDRGSKAIINFVNELNEAEYQGRKVKLGKPTRGDVKKFKVYVKNPKGNVVKVNFGHKGKGGEKTMRIKKSDPARRKSFRARHNCDNPGPRHKARYWSCRAW